MKFIKGLAKRKVSNWMNRDWYHQRFDGSPYFMHFIAEGEISMDKDRKKGGYFTVHYCFYEKGKADWYILMDDIKRVVDAVIRASKNNPDISSEFIQKWKPDYDRFYNKCIEVGKTDVGGLDDRGLMKLHDDFAEITLHRSSCSSLIDGFALGTDVMIADHIKEAYENSSLKDNMGFTDVFSGLTAPVHLSFINEAEVSLLRVAVKAEKEGLKDVFNSERHEKIHEHIRGTETLNLLEEHQRNYFWINNNYVSSYVLGVAHFIEELKNIFETDLDIKKEIERVERTPKRNRKNKGKLMKKIELSPEIKTLIRISEDFTYWQDERKKATFWATHYFSKILEEIGKRTGIGLEDIKYMTCREVSRIFKDNPGKEELKARMEKGAYYWDEEGIDALHSGEADEIIHAVLGSQDLSDVEEFRGLAACTGKATGPVKIVNSATEISKVEEGDILVAVMTRPDYVPAMRKSAAIVTDEGGVTSHAAIVSREIGVPCIIGTKTATTTLRDGVMVEVDADEGVVRKIKREADGNT